MKETICFVLAFLAMIFCVGVVGGVEDGKPITNLVWLLPGVAVIGITVHIGGFMKGR